MEYFVDFEAFKLTSKEYVVKELAIMPLGGSPLQFIFKPPCDLSDLPKPQIDENLWLMKNHLKMK